MRHDRRVARRFGAWIGAFVLPVCLFAANPAVGQVSTIGLDPDTTEKRLRPLNARFDGGVEESVRPMLARRSGAVPRLGPIELSVRPGFLKGHLLPRMSRQIGDVNTIHALETQRGWFENSSIHNWVSDEVGHRALRATRKAAKDYLYEATRIGSWLESRAVSVGGHGSGAVRSTKFKFDVSHGIPKVGLRHRAAIGATRFQVGVDGSVRLEFRPARSNAARFYAGYEAALAGYRLSYRVAF
jgi:hypothetical protein